MASNYDEELKTLPQWFKRMLEDEYRSIRESDRCEHRPTCQDDIYRATERFIKLYRNGEEWLKTVSAEDKTQCRRLFDVMCDTRHYYPQNAQVVIGGTRMIVDHKFDIFDLYLKIKEVFSG